MTNPTDKQIAFLRTLLAERAGNPDAENIRTGLNVAREHHALTRQVISGAIKDLMAIKVAKGGGCATKTAELPDVAEGFYATASRTGANDFDFWRVDRPTEGRWAGRTFVKRVIGGRADQAVRGAEATQALEAIKADPQAMARYGIEIGRCGRCNRHLTDETSRSLGIGPECRKHLG